MKKLMYLALAFIAIATGFTACQQKAMVTNTLSQRANDHLGDSLFGIEYDDYNWDTCMKYLDQYRPSKNGLCSEIYTGEFVGRNLDYYINQNACCIIKVDSNKAKSRYASIGMVGCCHDFSFSLADTGKYNDIYQYLPCRTEDGINEKGLYIGINVLPNRTKYLPANAIKYLDDNKIIAYQAEGNDTWYNTMCLTRFVLDNASCVDQAIDKIKKYNWYFPVGYSMADDAQFFHWLIADKRKSCVLEFIDGELKKVESDKIIPTKGDLSSYTGMIMTNFSNWHFYNEKMDKLGIGYERFEILANKFSERKPKNEVDMFNLMKNVWYSNSYRIPCDSDDYQNFWYTELSSMNSPSEKLFHNGKQIVEDTVAIRKINEYKSLWKNEKYWYGEIDTIWYTVHTSIYDLKNLKGFVVPHEGRRHSPDPSFVPDEKLYEFNFDSSYAKPLSLAPKQNDK